jgi:hypothetical protein
VRACIHAMAVVAMIASLGSAPSAAAEWRVVPEIRITGGDETDLLIDPGVTRTVVPGGAFIEFSPTLAARHGTGRGALLDFGTFATLQRFLNDDNRQLYAQTVWGDLYQSFGDALRGRLSLVVDYFDDSERETVRRFNEGAEGGLSLVRDRWSAEVWAGANARQYPNLTTVESMNRSVTYTETAWSGGATIRANPVERLALRGGTIVQTTSARDPYYDSRSWTVTGSADARLIASAFLTVSGSYQDRVFTDRHPGEDDDTYWQIGLGLRYLVAGGWTASVRYGYSSYTWPDGTKDDSQRLAVGFSYAWGRREAPLPPPIDLAAIAREGGPSIQRPGESGAVRLRVEAPDARSVAVAGSFNAWDPVALRSSGNGGWEIDLRLSPGSYEYVYVIDGVWTTPPESTITVDDGFGGRNGVLEVLPP